MIMPVHFQPTNAPEKRNQHSGFKFKLMRSKSLSVSKQETMLETCHVDPFYLACNFMLMLRAICEQTVVKKRQRRYLLFTTDTQWGVYATISIPVELDSYVSLGWFFEANYYVVDNATYFEPLLGDIYSESRNRQHRSIGGTNDILTRRALYIFIESMLERHGIPGRSCMLRAICENADAHFLHNGLIGDVLYFILTPSTSMPEDDIEDCFYEAEYYGLKNSCDKYFEDCPSNPLENISLYAENVLK